MSSAARCPSCPRSPALSRGAGTECLQVGCSGRGGPGSLLLGVLPFVTFSHPSSSVCATLLPRASPLCSELLVSSGWGETFFPPASFSGSGVCWPPIRGGLGEAPGGWSGSRSDGARGWTRQRTGVREGLVPCQLVVQDPCVWSPGRTCPSAQGPRVLNPRVRWAQGRRLAPSREQAPVPGPASSQRHSLTLSYRFSSSGAF